MVQKKRKLVRLSEDLEHAVVQAIIRGVVAPDAVEPEELSKTARAVVGGIRSLTAPYAPEAVVLAATEIYGVAKETVASYLKQVSTHYAGADAGEILSAVRDRQLLVEVINEATSQLQGHIDVGLLGGLLAQAPGGTSLSSVAERIKQGFPDPPQGVVLDSLPTLSNHVGGVYGVVALAGEPKVGKSTLAWQVGLDVARKMPVIHYDFENGFAVLMNRTRKMYNGDLERARSATSNLYVRDSIRSLDADLARVPAPAVVVVDPIQKLPSSIQYKRAGLDRWIHRLEELKKRGYHILMVSEIGRAHYGDEAHIGAYKETGEIEYSADTGLQLIPTGANDQVEVHVVANRHHPHKGLSCVLQRKRAWIWKEYQTMATAEEGEEID